MACALANFWDSSVTLWAGHSDSTKVAEPQPDDVGTPWRRAETSHDKHLLKIVMRPHCAAMIRPTKNRPIQLSTK